MFFNVFYLFGMACSSLLWGGRFLTPPYFWITASFDLFQKSLFKSFNGVFAHQFNDTITHD
ncbi:hypothetical protein HPHPA5_0685 [Helicobacter pylori Hp A-5]|nr:hypothetical protein HPHPA5_0685 [Helicobacter pylori Hp A-5]